MNAETTHKTTRTTTLPNGKMVVSKLDGEPGSIIQVCSMNRSRTRPTAYVVETVEGREIWDAADTFVPDAQD